MAENQFYAIPHSRGSDGQMDMADEGIRAGRYFGGGEDTWWICSCIMLSANTLAVSEPPD